MLSISWTMEDDSFGRTCAQAGSAVRIQVGRWVQSWPHASSVFDSAFHHANPRFFCKTSPSYVVQGSTGPVPSPPQSCAGLTCIAPMFSISWSALEAPSRTELTPSFRRHQAGDAERGA